MKLSLAAGAAALALSAQAAAAPPPGSPGNAEIDAYQRVANVANMVCTAPDQFGMVRSVGGQLTGHIEPSLVTKGLLKAGLGGKIDLSYKDWRGVEQAQLADALSRRNDCAKDLFGLMLSGRSRVTGTDGRAVPRPSSPEAVYIKLAQQQKPPIQQSTMAEAASGAAVANGNNNNEGFQGTNNGNVYLGYPTTRDEKQRAIVALEGQIRQLAAFPEAPNGAGIVSSQPPTMLEGHAVSHLPFRLFCVLNNSYIETVSELHGVGAAAAAFQRQYYDFERHQATLEEKLRLKVGTVAPNVMTQGWANIADYTVLRSAGNSAEDMKIAGYDPGFTSLDYAEKSYLLLIMDPAITAALARQQTRFNDLLRSAQSIAAHFQ